MTNIRDAMPKFIVGALAGLFLSAFSVGSSLSDELPIDHQRRNLNGFGFQLKQFQIEQGSEIAAATYYKDVLSAQIGFMSPDTILTSSIENLLAYFGYDSLGAIDLHVLTSKQLMALGSSDEILAIRFFAPKITDVADKAVEIPAKGFGWRKIVRLKARSGSPAETNGMDSLVILQNTFEATAGGDPYDPERNVSKFNQVIVTRKPVTFTPLQRPVYFVTYGPLVKIDANGKPAKVDSNFQKGGEIIYNLAATFDENDRDPETNADAKSYFVPDSCQQCHGGFSPIKGKLNYLDTDHWFDRVFPSYGLAEAKFDQEDFTALAQSPFGMLYDGGKDISTADFASAFAAIRKFNEEVKAQNEATGVVGNFQLEAVKKWLDLHRSDNQGDKHVPPYERGFGNEPWDPDDVEDRKLVYYLNRYCYRCHSSVKYNVFDRAAVKSRRFNFPERLTDISDPGNWMPQDRIFPGLEITQGVPDATGDLREFLDLTEKLQ
ncbi:hypothetical protein [Rhizobium leguminosarum]